MHICNKIIFHIFVPKDIFTGLILWAWSHSLLSMYFCACVGSTCEYMQIIGIERNFLTVTLSPLHKKTHLKSTFKAVIKNPVTGSWMEMVFFPGPLWSGFEDRPPGSDSPVPRGLRTGWLGETEKAISPYFPTFEWYVPLCNLLMRNAMEEMSVLLTTVILGYLNKSSPPPGVLAPANCCMMLL